ncbi:hypothetical protein TNCT_564511, partial [Trichonephila clavata]
MLPVLFMKKSFFVNGETVGSSFSDSSRISPTCQHSLFCQEGLRLALRKRISNRKQRLSCKYIVTMAVVLRIFAEFIRITVTLFRPISDYVLDFLYLLFMGKTKQLPPIDNKILLIPAVELAEKIRKRQ